MSDDMTGKRDDWIDQMRADYNAPPRTPREEMWAHIETRLKDAGADVVPIGHASTVRRRTVWIRWAASAAAAAALVALGVGLGRMSMEPSASIQVVEVVDEVTPGTSVFRVAAVQHLLKSESLLTLVSSDASAGRVDEEVGEWGRSLLLETRLLMDSPAGEDAVVRELLQDLELILIQVAGLAPNGGVPSVRHEEELGLIAEAMKSRDVMMRIRSILPQGGVQAGI